MPPFPSSKLITTPFSADESVRAQGLVPGRPGVRLVLALLRGYKILISPLFTGCCRFHPSCADYTAEAVTMHGAVRGVWLGMRRLVRCHPFGGHGFDPVPRA